MNEFPCVLCGKSIPQNFSADFGAVKVKCEECVKKEGDERALKSKRALMKAMLEIKRSQWTEEGLYALAETNEKIREILVEVKDTHSPFFLEQWLKGCRSISMKTFKSLVRKKREIYA